MAYKDKNKEKAKFRRYYWGHPFTRMAKAIKKRDPASNISAFDLWKLAKRQKLICALSGKPLTNNNISPDHIIPLSSGGNSLIDNIQLVTKDANLAKHSLDEKQFIDLCIDIIKYRVG